MHSLVCALHHGGNVTDCLNSFVPQLPCWWLKRTLSPVSWYSPGHFSQQQEQSCGGVHPSSSAVLNLTIFQSQRLLSLIWKSFLKYFHSFLIYTHCSLSIKYTETHMHTHASRHIQTHNKHTHTYIYDTCTHLTAECWSAFLQFLSGT